jgi:hypothetical protein
MLFSVLSSSHDNNDDFVHQLRNHLADIENNVQQTLNKIQQRQPLTILINRIDHIEHHTRKNFFHV